MSETHSAAQHIPLQNRQKQTRATVLRHVRTAKQMWTKSNPKHTKISHVELQKVSSINAQLEQNAELFVKGAFLFEKRLNASQTRLN